MQNTTNPLLVLTKAVIRMRALRLFMVAITLAMFTGDVSWAANTTEAQASVDDLIQQLDSTKFEERRRASESLFDLGRDAFEKLASAASGDSREVTERSIEILRRHYRSEDEETKTAAKQALEGLVSGKNPRIGRAAQEALQIEQQSQGPNPAQIARMQRVFPPQMRQQFPMLPPAAPNGQFARRTKVQIANGVKEIEVDYGNKQIKVQEAADGKIKATIIDTVDGKKVAKIIDAKNADDLKQKSPEAHKVYESVGKNAVAGVKIVQNMGGRPQPNAIPAPNNVKQMWGQTYDRLIKSLEDQKERMKQRLAAPEQAEQLKRMMDSLDQQIERIREQKKRIQAQP